MSSESVNEGILFGMMMITMTATDIATAIVKPLLLLLLLLSTTHCAFTSIASILWHDKSNEDDKKSSKVDANQKKQRNAAKMKTILKKFQDY